MNTVYKFKFKDGYFSFVLASSREEAETFVKSKSNEQFEYVGEKEVIELKKPMYLYSGVLKFSN